MRAANRIAVVGTGPRALTVAAGLARLGHRVVRYPSAHDEEVRTEPSLLAEARRAVLDGSLTATDDAARADAGTVLVDGLDDGGLAAVTDRAPRDRVVVDIGAEHPTSALDGRAAVPGAVAAQPVFLHAGSMVADFRSVQRIVVGAQTSDVVEHVLALYGDSVSEAVRTDLAGADLIRHAVNGYFAVKQSYVNALAELCSAVGADIDSVARALAYDARIGGQYTDPAPLSPPLHAGTAVLAREAGPERALLDAAGTGPGAVPVPQPRRPVRHAPARDG